ncbi:putative 13 KDA deflagellation-inducible protein [Planoprotostelium fungivorum]|uniref:Putative 13 kDa deflagellation-inducible protein n=1 Tax=Planoprotostelium fungivorum TaxID=1890364 RepID=A0A2P6NG59_9EUKA|nr:putative 13 KDA deflagellation-inducible protein [Planoprotostelium fungivorum]
MSNLLRRNASAVVDESEGSLDELKSRREQLLHLIEKEEEEKSRIQGEIKRLQGRVTRLDESLQSRYSARDEYDKTIKESEVAFLKILESSQTLLQVLKKETMNLDKKNQKEGHVTTESSNLVSFEKNFSYLSCAMDEPTLLSSSWRIYSRLLSSPVVDCSEIGVCTNGGQCSRGICFCPFNWTETDQSSVSYFACAVSTWWYTPTIPKVLSIMYITLCIDRLVWLSFDPHVLKGNLIFSILENVLGGISWWARVHRSATWGTKKHKSNLPGMFLTLYASSLSADIICRVLWRYYPPYSNAYFTVLAVYFIFEMAFVAGAMRLTIFYGMRLRYNLLQLCGSHADVTSRLNRINHLMMGSVSLSLFILLCMVGNIVLPYAFPSLTTSRTQFYLAGQFVYRAFEVACTLLMVYELRSSELGSKKLSDHLSLNRDSFYDRDSNVGLLTSDRE